MATTQVKFPKIIHNSWHDALEEAFIDSKMELLKTKILPHIKYYPPPNDVFKVFSKPMEDTKVVILGQDPYPNFGQANGLAFAVNKDIAEPPSLGVIKKEVFKNMDKEALNKYIKEFAVKYPGYSWRTLQHWQDQGVLLLNTALTVRAGEAASHLDYWRFFTRIAIRAISLNQMRPIWMMWGAKAKAYVGYIHGYYKWNKDYKGLEYNYILEAPHPAAEMYPNGYAQQKFTGCNHFNTANDILKFKKQSPIEW